MSTSINITNPGNYKCDIKVKDITQIAQITYCLYFHKEITYNRVAPFQYILYTDYM